MRTLLFGLGNSILSDDAIGLVVARRVHEILGQERADLVEASVAGMDVVDLVAGYEKVVIIDAITTGDGEVGRLYWLGPDDILSTPRLASAHDMSLGESLALGRRLGLPMPDEVVVCVIEVLDTFTFGETLSPEVARLVPQIVSAIVHAQFGDGQAATAVGRSE